MKKFIDAFNGLTLALNHKAVVVQIFLGILAVVGGLIIRLDYYEWLAFIICIVSVVSLEIFNTVCEKIADYLNLKYDERIKNIKDLASAAVLIECLGTLLICLFTIFRRIL